jgi:hypothetical protein
MSTPRELQAQLEEAQQALREAEKEIDRQRKEAAAAAETPEDARALIAAISKVDLPAFWEADPVLWFRQCESAFRRSGQVSQGVKFDHVVGKLPNAVSLSCRSLLLSINFEDKDCYDRLKDHLCKNFGKSKWQQGYALLDCANLGDRRPSQLLQDMRALLPQNEPEGVLFSCLFLKRLPTTMADAIMAAGLENIEEMAAMADRLFDRPAAATVSTVSAKHTCCGQDVSAIDSQQRRNNNRGRGRNGRSPNRRAARSPERRAATPGARMPWDEFKKKRPASVWVKGAKPDWCAKHQYWGAQAWDCAPGCSYQEN